MSNNASPVEVDQISLYGLRVAFPGFILWDIFAVVNILSIILSIYVVTLTKFMTPLLRKVIILHLLIEAIFSVEAAVMASYHLHVYSQGVPETMKPYDCLKYISTTFVLVHYSYWLMLLCSVDRMLAIFRPNFYKAGGHRRPINRVLVAITIFQFLELTGYHLDTYDDDLIPLCLPKQALGAHSLPYYSCMSVILSITPPIIYLSCFVYLFYKDAVGHPDGAGLIKKRIKNRVTWVLIFMTFWQLTTIAVASVYGLFTNNLPYHGNFTVGPLSGSLCLLNGAAYLLANCLYVKNFRSAVFKVLSGKSLNATGPATSSNT